MSTVALIGLSTLEEIAIISIVNGVSREGVENKMEILSFPHFSVERVESKHPKAYIVTADELLKNLDYFLPRRNKVVGISRVSKSSLYDSADKGGFALICGDSEREEIVALLSSLLGEGEASSDISGELSQREREVLSQLASGKTNKEIADFLSISVNTVITHRKNISGKLGIKSVSGLSLYALMNGII